MSKKHGFFWYLSIFFSIIALICLFFVLSLIFFPDNPILKTKTPEKVEMVKAKKSQKVEKIMEKLKNEKNKRGEDKSKNQDRPKEKDISQNFEKKDFSIKISEEELNEHLKYIAEKNNLRDQGIRNIYVALGPGRITGYFTIDSQKVRENVKRKLPLSIKGDIDVKLEGHFLKAGNLNYFKIDSVQIGRIPLIDGLKERFIQKLLSKNKLLYLYSSQNGIRLPGKIKDIEASSSYLAINLYEN